MGTRDDQRSKVVSPSSRKKEIRPWRTEREFRKTPGVSKLVSRKLQTNWGLNNRRHSRRQERLIMKKRGKLQGKDSEDAEWGVGEAGRAQKKGVVYFWGIETYLSNV